MLVHRWTCTNVHKRVLFCAGSEARERQLLMKGTATVISAVTFFFGFPRQRVFFPRTRKKIKVDRKLKHFKGNRQKTTRHARVFIGITRPNSLYFQGDDQQEAEGDCGAGAELRQLQPAAAQGAARGAQQLRGALPEQRKTVSVLFSPSRTLFSLPFLSETQVDCYLRRRQTAAPRAGMNYITSRLPPLNL